MPELRIRPMQRSDVALLVRYWTEASPADLDRMGVDASKLPPAEVLAGQLAALLDAPERTTKAAYVIWLLDGRPVGHGSLKSIAYGSRGEMHLHMWDPSVRGKGHGATWFCLSALHFYERFGLREIVCEPSATNAMPNRMLRRAGFRRLGTRVGASSELSKVTELNTYAIDRDVAARYLRQAASTPSEE